MAIRAEATIEIAKPPSVVFGFIEDFSQAPMWLEGCVQLAQISAGPRGAGKALRYVHRQGGRQGEMAGTIAAYEPGRRLALGFADSGFEIAVEVVITKADGRTFVHHSVEITPRSFMGRLMSPMLKGFNRKQVERNAARLKERVEALAATPAPASGRYDAWTCPFCEVPAIRPTEAGVLCDSRTCECGAIGLAARACDRDEIIDDAIGLFGVGIREDTRGYDAMLLENVRMAGVDIRHGKTVPGPSGRKGTDLTSLWFRRQPKK